jgi:hypothetical protein
MLDYGRMHARGRPGSNATLAAWDVDCSLSNLRTFFVAGICKHGQKYQTHVKEVAENKNQNHVQTEEIEKGNNQTWAVP